MEEWGGQKHVLVGSVTGLLDRGWCGKSHSSILNQTVEIKAAGIPFGLIELLGNRISCSYSFKYAPNLYPDYSFHLFCWYLCFCCGHLPHFHSIDVIIASFDNDFAFLFPLYQLQVMLWQYI